MSHWAKSKPEGLAYTRRTFGKAVLNGGMAILWLGIENAIAQTPVSSAPKRFSSGVAEGYLRPTVCGGLGRSCSSGAQLDALLAAIGLTHGQQTALAELQGVFALKGGFVVTVRAFDANWNDSWFGEGYDIDGCRVELVDVAIAVTDGRMSRADFEENYLLRMTTDTLHLTPSQRSRQVSGDRYVTAAMRVEVHCLLPEHRYVANLQRSETSVALETYLPGVSAVAVVE